LAHLILLGIVYVSFISLGLPDAILGVAWPAIRADMGQPLAAVGAITIAMTLSAATASSLAGTIAKRLGTGTIVAASCLMTALALLCFSVAPSFVWLVALGVPLGLGAGAVDACLNHFVAAHYSSRHMNWLHGFWGVGATSGPLIMGLALSGSGGWASGVRTIGLMQLSLAVLLGATLSLWSKEHSKPPSTQGPHETAAFKPVRTLALWLAPALFLLYVAAEMGTGLWAASILVADRGVTTAQASVWVSVYFGSITAGRFAVGLIANRLGNRRMVRLGIAMATTGALVFALPMVFGEFASLGLVLMGLGCAPVFPSLMHETARRFPDEVARMVIGRQMTFAYAGGSVIPAAFGLLATWAGLAAVMPVVVALLVTLLAMVVVLDRMT
jgi:fucose permease